MVVWCQQDISLLYKQIKFQPVHILSKLGKKRVFTDAR